MERRGAEAARSEARRDLAACTARRPPNRYPKTNSTPPNPPPPTVSLLSLESSQQPRVAHPRPHRASSNAAPWELLSLSNLRLPFSYLRTALHPCLLVRRGCPPRRGGRWARPGIPLVVSHSRSVAAQEINPPRVVLLPAAQGRLAAVATNPFRSFDSRVSFGAPRG